jgi:hypothetical protein
VRVNIIIMGNADKNSPKFLNKTIIGRLIRQFRLSWLPEGFYNRFGKEDFDQQLGEVIKGRYTTYRDLGWGGSLQVLIKQLLYPLTKKNPYEGVTRNSDGKPIQPVDIENMRRNLAELGMYATLMAVILTLKNMRDDDDEENPGTQIMINLLIRTAQDIGFYVSPSVFEVVTRNPIPAMSVLIDYGKLFTATGKLITDSDYEFEQWLFKLTKAGLPIPQATLANKIRYMSNRDLDTAR